MKHDYRWNPTAEPRADGLLDWKCLNCGDLKTTPLHGADPENSEGCPGSERDKAVAEWRMRRLWHEQEMSSPRRSRYMADVRHPLKQILHADKTIGWREYRKPVPEPKVLPPMMAKCSKCERLVDVSDRSHSCFSQRVWSHLK